MDMPVVALFVLLVAYRFAETAKVPRGENAVKGWAGDWSLWAIMVPWLVTLAGGLVEHLLMRMQPHTAWLVASGAAMAVGIVIRAKARRDLGGSFAVTVRTPDENEVVRRGLYGAIRHPLYLGHILMMVGIPALLGCRWAWIPATVGVAATVLRCVVEERYLAENLRGYREYMGQTWRLIPHLW